MPLSVRTDNLNVSIMGPPADSSYQFCVEGYFGVENLGNRAVLLGFAGNPGEGSFVQVRHFGAQGQRRPADAEALALRLEGDRGLGAELRRRIASALKPKGQGNTQPHRALTKRPSP